MKLRRLGSLLLLLMFVSDLGFASSQEDKERAERGRYLGRAKPHKDFVQPALIKRVEASYPDKARSSGVRGPVVVEITLDEAGKIASVRPLRGYRILRAAAVEAVRKWDFEPARSNGNPVKVVAAVTFCFSGDSELSTSRYTFTFQRCCPESQKSAKESCPRAKKRVRARPAIFKPD